MTTTTENAAATTEPQFSIITAVYNPPRDAFADTVRAVREQTFTDLEWVLVDDCSPNAEVGQHLAALAATEPRVRVIEREVNGGIVAASSDALSAARGEYVALLDHDDVLDVEALSTMAEPSRTTRTPTTSTAIRT